MNRVRHATKLAAALLLLAPSTAAAAGTATGNLAVSATVIASCSVVTTNPLAFGNYDPISATPNDAATTISVTCTNGSGYDVLMNAGGGSGATIAARKMTSSGNLLTYAIYRDTNRTNLWGVTLGSNVVSGVGTGAAQSIDVYGRIPANQTAPVGSYTDTVVVTVSY